MSENEKEINKGEIVGVESNKPLVIFKTKEDRYGQDIALMSDFFDGYVQQMSLAIREKSELEIMTELPIGDLGIINDVVHQAGVIMKGNITLLPDFDNLPPDIKSKLKRGIYSVGESRQVEDNLRAVIVDEEGTRVKDITLKKVVNNPDNIDVVRSIGNQLQMRQIYTKLSGIQEMQNYQLEKDRDRDIVAPFLDARMLVLEAETKENEEERIKLLKEADGKMRTAINAVTRDIETTSKWLAKSVKNPFHDFSNKMDTYMGYLTSDLQVVTKYVGVRMQLLEYVGDRKTAQTVLQSYQHTMYDFLTKPVTRKGLSTADLMQNYFPYTTENMNCWLKFSEEMTPVLETSMKNLELSMNNDLSKEVYIVSVEDIDDEEE
ncbi:hypothetical protein GKG47_19575 [Lactonifactor sp. BIOML-A3]|uniref:hypothetical protein n=1 Tax=unclassified Lactonifactor TaxID=2636670 RepID=UPI0012B06957|nr:MULTISPECIES: hypothetical protein [unclassified Lactonifactor]MSA03612.1 hypothetical protein [Lactonifactor sp. BIOML-A5]MSA10113.1 hypothetical protein [Lactonifactor sp. BIOML-A4]MSA14619.1 hypothetical protein [Lactonifactor sp. BIOML-A3]MSA19041.1 hypothetical protein [Lactonifactor sp. BIOML-A2]MSA39759.1 hypothetical protein [Lactonifactor sp. BIOML-A1]